MKLTRPRRSNVGHVLLLNTFLLDFNGLELVLSWVMDGVVGGGETVFDVLVLFRRLGRLYLVTDNEGESGFLVHNDHVVVVDLLRIRLCNSMSLFLDLAIGSGLEIAEWPGIETSAETLLPCWITLNLESSTPFWRMITQTADCVPCFDDKAVSPWIGSPWWNVT